MDIQRALVTAYDATTHTAAVLLVGSMSRILLGVPVSQQVPPDHMVAGTACAVAFFAEGSKGVVLATFQGAVTPPLVLDTYGPPLTLTDLIRGWHDDFMGDQLADQYTTAVNGAGSTTGFIAWHGGIYSLTAGATNGYWARIWLGNTADTYPILDADYGWRQLVRLQISHTTNIQATIEAVHIGLNRQIVCGLRTDVLANNWLIRTVNAAGTTNADTGVAADTAWHWHCIDTYPTDAGHQVDYYLDGTLIGSSTTNVPTDNLTPNIIAINRNVAANRSLSIDYWAVIPRVPP